MDTTVWQTQLGRLVVYATLCSLAGLVYTGLSNRQLRSIPRVGKSPGVLGLGLQQAKSEFFSNGKQLLDEGYAKFKSSMFLVQTSDLPRIVLSTKYLEELRGLPESKLSHRESVCDRFLGYWTGLDVVRQSQLHNDICRTTLVQNLPTLIPRMNNEATMAIFENFGQVSAKSPTEISLYGSIINIVARINSRVLVGLPLCRDKEWLEVAGGYPQDSVAVATDLRRWPPILRPFVYPFLASTKRLRREYAIVNKKLRPLIAEREKTKAQEKAQDVLQWMMDMGKGEDIKVKNIVGKMLFLTMAGFHAPTTTAVHVLYDLCSKPEYFKTLRQEIEDALAVTGGEWSIAALRRMEKLDSFIKESQRMNAPGLRESIYFLPHHHTPVRLTPKKRELIKDNSRL